MSSAPSLPNISTYCSRDIAASLSGFGGYVVEEGLIRFWIDKPRPRTLELVREPPRAQDYETLISLVAVDRLAKNAAHLIAATWQRDGVLNYVYKNRHHFHRPLGGASPKQLHGNLDAVIHLYFLTDHRVEAILHELVDEVPGEIDGSLKGGIRAAPNPHL